MNLAPSDRLADLCQTATEVFGRLGYKRTKMADIATAARMSTGAVYLYVDSKEALLHAVLAGHFGKLEPLEIPIKAPELSETITLVARGLKQEAATPALAAALASGPPADPEAELRRVLEEMFDMIERLWPVLAVIERCAVDIPELDELYFGRRRRAHNSAFHRYVQRRVDEGCFTALPDVEVAAQVAIEAITWFAWKRLEGHDADRFNAKSGRLAVIGFVCNAFIPIGQPV